MAIYIHKEKIHNTESAKIVLPLVFDFIKADSVLDVGCGIGTWLYVAKNFGVRDVIGVDGDFVEKNLLEKHIKPNEFVSADIRFPFHINRKFDLAICLEVAEHLPPASASTLVDSLTKYSDVILFSAAIPGQGGQNHLNEQWPEYWAEKFRNHDYVFLDLIRPHIWNNEKVDFWYKQNIFLVVKMSHKLAISNSESFLSLVHPELLARVQDAITKQIKSLKANLAIHPLKRWVKSLIS